ncbi:MAG TPA: class I SAM-dependent methyltransferase [Vitreimonas sp.]|uniref:class I SAM-dependent methyltransferase n=1 Tax=Vitreimonas sp. TaxID=3069702 RepID=UPI002D4814B0|nr:class I SAM-dependent methyltransferase [Vitreimonas sp.]HYD87716.1 class I SAM-dependent methyltransferase [Vitreimonas sp.]
MKECSKAIPRRLKDSRFASRYLVGSGVDIGGKPDPLSIYREFFPGITALRVWDIEDGDAQLMQGVADEAFDFVFSSHCLEHLRDPREGLVNWFRVLKPGGHLVITIPDEDLYEQGVWPSTHNRDHKSSFTIAKSRSWCPASVNVFELLRELGPAADVRKIEVIDETYRFELPRFDQTLTPVAECAIEMIVRKRTARELDAGGRLPPTAQPATEQRVYFNQYRNDQAALKTAELPAPLFGDKSDL